MYILRKDFQTLLSSAAITVESFKSMGANFCGLLKFYRIVGT